MIYVGLLDMQMNIEFDLWDQETNRSDDYIGSVTMALDDVVRQADGLRQRDWLPLYA